ncbi:MAG: GTPase domain-containing protein [Candidatus Thorarchaeota archaeon]
MLNPPNILLTGENGVGKTTILNLFPGDIILELDDDLNEIFQKPIDIPNVKGVEQCILREIDLRELINKFESFRQLLRSIDVICIVTDSTERNVKNTKELISELKNKLSEIDFYVIANFQDRKSISFSTGKVETILKEKTFGFSAIKEDSKNGIVVIFKEILKRLTLEKEEINDIIPAIGEADLENIWSEIDEARILEIRGNFFSSAEKFLTVASKLKSISSEQAKGEITALYYLCKAWECMELAEEYKNTQKFSEAINHFNQAYEYLSNKKFKLLVQGNTIFCEALKLSIDFDKSDALNKKEEYYPKIKNLIKKAIKLYKEGGYQKEAEWALATLNNLN